jgi:hypothetical protein
MLEKRIWAADERRQKTQMKALIKGCSGSQRRNRYPPRLLGQRNGFMALLEALATIAGLSTGLGPFVRNSFAKN